MERVLDIFMGKDIFKKQEIIDNMEKNLKIFTDKFLSEDISMISAEVKTKGYYSFDDAVTSEFIDETVRMLNKKNKVEFNKNWPTGVNMTGQYFFTHLLTLSKYMINYVCAENIRNVASEVLGSKSIRLKAMRYYETYGGFHMQWHTDNKTDRSFAHIPGIIVICYLSDVNEGEFQYIRGSHKWSGEKAYSDYTDEFIEKNYSNDIISFKKRKGAIIIYNTYGIHRARPVYNKKFKRKSIFFQIDAEINNGEPILINPHFLGELTPELKTYLGFDLPANYEIFPNSNINDHPLDLNSFKNILFWMFIRLLRGAFEFLPLKTKLKLKKYIKA